MRHPVLSSCLFAVLVGGCLPNAPSLEADAEAPATATYSVRVAQADGTKAFLEAMPRWPTLTVEGAPLPSPDSGRWLILPEPPTPSLESDLRRWPLNATRQARAIVPLVQATEGGVLLEMPVPLLADTAYTLVAGPAGGEDEGLGFGLRTTKDPMGGVSVIASLPGDGHAQVPESLSRIAILTNGALEGPQVNLHGPAGERVSLVLSGRPCGAQAEHCYEAPLDAALPEGHYRLTLTTPLDAVGNRPIPFEAEFEVVAQDPAPAPALLKTPCAPDETTTEAGLCVLVHDRWLRVRGRLDQAAVVSAHDVTTPPRERSAPLNLTLSPRGEFVLTLRGLEPSSPLRLVLRATSLVGTASNWPLDLTTREPMPQIAITESRANPVGAEPAQEYVELHNYGAAKVSLDGYQLADDPFKAGDPLPTGVWVRGGERILIVPESFDPDDSADTPPVPASTRLVRIDSSLGAGGLSNRGEPLLLRDGEGRRVSELIPLDIEEGRCASSIEGGATSSPCTPGR